MKHILIMNWQGEYFLTFYTNLSFFYAIFD